MTFMRALIIAQDRGTLSTVRRGKRYLIAIAVSLLTASSLIAQENATPTVETEATSEASVATQREIVRKEEAIFRATQSLLEGLVLEEAGAYAKAKQIYAAALGSITPSPGTQKAYDQAVQGLVRVNNVLIEQAKAQGDRDAIEALLKNSLTYDPQNKSLQEQMAKLEESKRKPTDTTYFGNPGMNSSFVKQVETVQSLFEQAEQFRRTGQYEEAEARLKKIIAIDPYNQAAQKQLAKILKEKMAYVEIARRESRAQKLLEIEEKWAQPIKRESAETVTNVATRPITRSNQFQINQKLKSIILPSVDFSDASLQDVVNFLNARTRDLDLPDKQGINFIPRPEAIISSKSINLNLKNIPLGEALRYITALAGVKYKIDQAGVFFVPLQEVTDVLVRRSFPVPPGFFPVTAPGGAGAAAGDRGVSLRRTPAAASAVSTSGTSNVTGQLKERGVQFTAQGASAIYLAAQGVLQVLNTQEQIDLIEELVNAESGQTLLVDVEAKLVEINQQDLNDLTANTSFNIINTLTPAQLLQAPQYTSALRGSSGFTNNNLDSLLGFSSNPVSSRFELTGMLDGRVYSMVLTALSQKSSTDLLSSPSIRVRSGEKATINISRTFFYPETFREPELVTTGSSTGTTTTVSVPNPPAAIPAFPESFAKEEIGVILNVYPTVGGDNRTIDLSLVPEVTDFEGFINYGSPITVPNAAGTPFIITDNYIPQPVFNVRRVTTKVFVRDGYTVMLGGIIREDVQTVTDKVPFLGDIPLVGRLFQSKADKRIKKNLLIFVSAKIMRPDGELFNAPIATPAGTSVSSR
jgi:general secretion pathway protein D